MCKLIKFCLMAVIWTRFQDEVLALEEDPSSIEPSKRNLEGTMPFILEPEEVEDGSTASSSGDGSEDNDPILSTTTPVPVEESNTTVFDPYPKNLQPDIKPVFNETVEKILEEIKNVTYTTTQVVVMFDFKEQFWKDGIVPYVISSQYDETEKRQIITAMDMIKSQSCIRFVENTNGSYVHYIDINKGNNTECKASHVGNEGGRQDVFLASHCLSKGPGEALHEFMKVLGFFQEHQRADRDSYIEVLWQNVDQSNWTHFQMRPAGNPQDACYEYDFSSIMHISTTAFTIDGNRRAFNLTEPLTRNVEIGQRQRLSELDVKKLKQMYNCALDPEEAAAIKVLEEENRKFIHELVQQCQDYEQPLREVCMAMVSELDNCEAQA